MSDLRGPCGCVLECADDIVRCDICKVNLCVYCFAAQGHPGGRLCNPPDKRTFTKCQQAMFDAEVMLISKDKGYGYTSAIVWRPCEDKPFVLYRTELDNRIPNQFFTSLEEAVLAYEGLV